MRILSVRLIISLILGVTLVSLLSSYFEVRSEKRGLRRELERRAELLAESLAGNVEPYLNERSLKQLQRIVGRFSNREHLQPIAASSGLDQQLKNGSLPVPQAMVDNKRQGQFIRRAGGAQHVYAFPLHQNDQVVGELVIVHDANYIDAQTARVWRESFLRVLLQVVVIALVTLLIVRWSIAGPIARAAQWMKALRTGRVGLVRGALPDLDLLRPLAREMETLAESLRAARSGGDLSAADSRVSRTTAGYRWRRSNPSPPANTIWRSATSAIQAFATGPIASRSTIGPSSPPPCRCASHQARPPD